MSKQPHFNLGRESRVFWRVPSLSPYRLLLAKIKKGATRKTVLAFLFGGSRREPVAISDRRPPEAAPLPGAAARLAELWHREGAPGAAAAEAAFGGGGGTPGAKRLLLTWTYGCGSKMGTQNGTLVNRNMDQNLRSPGGLILTHTHMAVVVKTNGIPFWDWCTTHFGQFFGDWDVHWGYGLLTHGRSKGCCIGECDVACDVW